MVSLRSASVLVTGGAGFIGANLIEELLRHGAHVEVLVRPQTDVWRIQRHLTKLKVHRLDLLAASGVRRIIRAQSPNYIFHLATSRAEGTPGERRRTLQNNVVGILNLLEAVRDVNVSGFVNLGSSLEYGPRSRAHRESDTPHPRLFYGFSKLAATTLAQHFARTTGMRLVNLRIFSAYGSWDGANRLIPAAILAALHGLELRLTRPGHRRDPIFIQDVVQACLVAAGVECEPGSIFNIGSGTEWTNEQIVEKIEKLSERTLRREIGTFPDRAADTPHWVADIRSAARVLGWTPQHDLDEGLRKTIAWFRRHGGAYARSLGSTNA